VFYLYTTMFASNKRSNNNQTGGFGLGSKAPLAYVDSFTVISRHNHLETTYAIYKDPTGTPRVGKLESRSYVGPTGLKVQVPIKNSDFFKLTQHAQNLLPFFPVCPEINLDIQPLEYLIKTETYGILKRHETERREGRVQVGNVTYPLNPSHYTWNGSDDTPSYSEAHTIAARPFVIFVPMGSVDIAPSREELSYDERTIALINSRLISTYQNLKTDIPAYINQFEKNWDKLVAFDSLNYALYEASIVDKTATNIAQPGHKRPTRFLHSIPNPNPARKNWKNHTHCIKGTTH
jgi:hypothetical protein